MTYHGVAGVQFTSQCTFPDYATPFPVPLARTSLRLCWVETNALTNTPWTTSQWTVASCIGVKIGYMLAMTRAIINAMYICMAWGIMRLFLAIRVWFRSAERSACILYPRGTSHSGCTSESAIGWKLYGDEIGTERFLYYGTASWHIFVTSTSVGYGPGLLLELGVGGCIS